MIFSDFFCNSSRPSCRISGVFLFPPYLTGFIIAAAVVETICHRFASPYVPSDRLGCVPLPVRPPASRAAGRDD